ncbi:MAG TPA: four helix bundle protein [Candidatus Solibacter sp.]|nr:four helix bundle protein [Candidatus Solibacter sp.]
MKDFKELRVWQKSHSLALEVYQATRSFPRDEIYGLTSQIRRAAVSVGANIAEGCGRRSDGEFARFLQIARGSAAELEYHLLFARDLKLLTNDAHQDFEKKLVEVQRMLTSLVTSVAEKSAGRLAKPGVTKGPPGARSQ